MNEIASEPPDYELLRRIELRTEAPIEAEAAFNVFFNRHRDYLLGQVRVASARLSVAKLDEVDFVIRVFTKVWEGASQTYRHDEAGNDVDQRTSTRAWLGKILFNLVLDELRCRRKVAEFDPSSQTTRESTEEHKRTGGNAAVDQITVVASVLSERDAKVIWFKIASYDPATGDSEPPPDALKVFCSELGITPEYLRKIYSRGIQSLRDAMATVTP